MGILIKTPNPSTSSGERTVLKLDANLNATVIVVADTTGLKLNDFVVIGTPGNITAEIVRITAVTPDVSYTVTALENAHAAGEPVTFIRFDKAQFYRSDTKTGSQTLLVTLDIAIENAYGETSYYDTVGDNTKWYQIAFVNTFNSDSVFGDIVEGGQHEYATVQDFRDISGFSQAEVPDDKVKFYLHDAYIHVLKGAYAFVRGDVLTKRTDPSSVMRWYFGRTPRQGYIADGDLNNIVDVDDLKVWEYDQWDEADITAQVDVINVQQGYITFLPGYPTGTRSVKVDFYLARKPLEEIQEELKQASCYMAVWLAMKEIALRFTKNGVVGYSIDGVNVSKSRADFDKTMEDFKKKAEYYMWLIKPMLVTPWVTGKTEAPMTSTRLRGWY
jgi:hypothetical protein